MKATTILVGTDFTPASQIAFDVACRLARQCGATVMVLHVEEGQPAHLGPAYYGIPDPDIKRIVHELVEYKSPGDGVIVEHWIRAGLAASEVPRLATEKSADMIVVGSHGGHGVGKLLLGSVATALLRHPPCPVLVCHSPQPRASRN